MKRALTILAVVLAVGCATMDSGEKLTLVEVAPVAGAAEGQPKALSMRIIHWGDSKTSPPVEHSTTKMIADQTRKVFTSRPLQ